MSVGPPPLHGTYAVPAAAAMTSLDSRRTRLPAGAGGGLRSNSTDSTTTLSITPGAPTPPNSLGSTRVGSPNLTALAGGGATTLSRRPSYRRRPYFGDAIRQLLVYVHPECTITEGGADYLDFHVRLHLGVAGPRAMS